jgi:uncharacterized membrane protein HdeD (DUF308 family)
MPNTRKKWYQSKTNWTGITTIVGAVAGYLTGAIDPVTAAQTIVAGFALIFLRQGVAKSGPEA